MSKRQATHPIEGYLYQFNSTILELLKANMDDEITIEGIEDIDIFSVGLLTAVQCKYHAEQSYTPSEIKEAIQLMVMHYKQELDKGMPVSLKYKYFGHFKSGHDKLDLPISLQFLKKDLLSGKKDGQKYEKHKELKLSDQLLQDFINLLVIDINAPSYEDQEMQIFEAFQKESGLNCGSLDEAQGFFYSNALSIIAELSRQHDINNRNITKSDFLTRINTKQYFFDKWFLAYKTQKQYIAYIKQLYFPSMLNQPAYERFFLIDTQGGSFQEVKRLVLEIKRKYTKHNRIGQKSFCPYIYLHNFDAELKDLKVQLQKEGTNIIDGFDFENADFSSVSLIKQVDYHNQIGLKFINKIDFLHEVFSMQDRKTKELYQFYFNKILYSQKHDDVMQVAIAVQSIRDIGKII